MSKSWDETKEQSFSEASLSTETFKWAIESIDKNKASIGVLENIVKNGISSDKTIQDIENHLKDIRRNIKNEIGLKENSLDNLSLNTPNSYKLQVSIPSNLNYLMKAWAAAEGRDLSSVALQCLEIGLREMKSKGSIPLAAVKRYDLACEKRIALAEANNAWEKHEDKNIRNLTR